MSGFFQHVWPFITTRQWRLMAITMEKSIDISTKLSINWLCGSVMESFVYNFIKRFHVFLRPWVLFRKKPPWFIFVSRVYFSLKLCPSYQCLLKCLHKKNFSVVWIKISFPEACTNQVFGNFYIWLQKNTKQKKLLTLFCL